MAYAHANKATIVAAHSRSAVDTGSPEVQCALLTHRIDELESHLAKHPADASCVRSIKKLSSRRKSLLAYLAAKNEPVYTQLIDNLRIKDIRQAV